MISDFYTFSESEIITNIRGLGRYPYTCGNIVTRINVFFSGQTWVTPYFQILYNNGVTSGSP